MRFLISFLLGSLLLAAQSSEQITFLKDIMPIMNKVGCTSGPCHGAAKGKNGFKLSLRGYDPLFDYEALLYDVAGRRFNRADPARSLLLAKPTMQVPHGGGVRIELGSAYYKAILNWLSKGAPFGDPVRDKVVKLEVQPAELFFDGPGTKQKIATKAHYGDGSMRDVTAEANISSNTPDTAEVAAGAQIDAKRKGEAALLVRYEGKFVTVPVTVLNPKQGFTFTALAQHNYIDQLIDAKLKRLKIQPSRAASDAEFLRRVSLDLTGLPPSPKEIREFLAEPGDAKTKRARAVDRLMKRPAYLDQWTVKWGDLLQNSRRYLGDKATWGFREWIRDSLAANKPYDKMVRELLTSRGSAYENPAANYFRVTRDPKPSMEKTSQVFLGVRMVCAQCHDHPFEQWTQNQYYQLAAFFAAVGLKAGYETGDEILFLKRDDNIVKHPKTGSTVKPQYLVASIGAPPIPEQGDHREALVQWLTSKNNPFFAKAIVNRMWSYFFGKGIIDPVDDIRASNPPSNEPLLAALTRDFTDHDFDLNHLVRTIATSRAYQASIESNEWNEDDHTNFSHQSPRRLTAEQLLDALELATGSRPKFAEVPEDTRAQQLPDPHVGKDGFLDLFGRPQRESACECERRVDLSLPQALNLVNGGDIAASIADPKGRISKMITTGQTDKELLEEMYLTTLGRLPTPGEYDKAVTFLRGGASRAARAQDLLWALVNSKAFLFNR
ncbi:MAG TPA: DUF1549 and DUF1553 domain-containing protein [Bryobacteraceae bacterium]|nr:DUF1549 and DUF1553 domain-containing protein [Bryobacteraceae bacterium]